LEKFFPTIKSAQECINRLEQNWINNEIQSFRIELKNAESSGKDPIPLMKKIDEFQARKNNLIHHRNAAE